LNTEQLKTLIWLAAALLLSITALVHLPPRIELESQAKVNEALFGEYQASNVWAIEIQRPASQDFRRRNPTAVVEQLTVKRTANRGWELLEYQSYPAENSQRIGLISGLLSNLKVLEVVSESASPTELAEYELLPPEEESGPESQKATLIKVSDASQNVLGELLVGRIVAQTGQARQTVYVRPANENAIYRVAMDKEQLTTNLLDWVNPNPLGLELPAGGPVIGPAFRVVERVHVSTPPEGRQDSDPYRAAFRFDEQLALENLATYTAGQWTTIPVRRLPASPEFNQNWRMGVRMVPSIVAMIDVKRKSDGLAGDLRTAVLPANLDAGELESLGIRLDKDEDGQPHLLGSSGNLRVQVEGGLQFQLALGEPNEAGLLPMVIHASPDSQRPLPRPEMEDLPAEAEDWEEDRRQRELENRQRDHNRRLDEWTRRTQQVAQDLESLNGRLAPWIFMVPTDYAMRAVPGIRLGQGATAGSAEPADSGADSGDNSTDDSGDNSADNSAD